MQSSDPSAIALMQIEAIALPKARNGCDATSCGRFW
jgi:hypothetical protein